jgi:hypothetical protein
VQIEARDVVPIGQQRTEPIAARIVIQIAVRDADQIEQLRTEPIAVPIVWQIVVRDADQIELQEIERIVAQIAVLVQTDLLVVVQADRDSAHVDMVDLIDDLTSAVILVVAS